jgi:hypothetical protein
MTARTHSECSDNEARVSNRLRWHLFATPLMRRALKAAARQKPPIVSGAEALRRAGPAKA